MKTIKNECVFLSVLNAGGFDCLRAGRSRHAKEFFVNAHQWK